MYFYYNDSFLKTEEWIEEERGGKTEGMRY
jgi:hypothetical protein